MERGSRGTKPKSSYEKDGGRSIVVRKLGGKYLCVHCCVKLSEPILQRNIESSWIEVRDLKSYATVRKAKVSFVVVNKAEGDFPV